MKRNVLATMIFALCFAVAMLLHAASESKYDTDLTAAAVTFGPVNGRTIVKSVYGTSDLDGATFKLYARTGNKVAPTTSPTNGATVIAISNASSTITTNDHVVYVHDNGTLDKTTVSASTTSNITLAAAITVAGATGDFVYEVSQQAQLDFSTTGAAVGTNVYGKFEGFVFATPGDSPLYVVLDGTSNAVINVTVEK